MGYYRDSVGYECAKCDDDCGTCTQPGTCSTCHDGFRKGRNRCLDCNEDEFISIDTCTPCSTFNNGCSGCGQDDPTTCLECAEHYELTQSSTCVCQQSFYFDSTAQNCKTCSQYCLECENGSTCLTCDSALDLVDSQCMLKDCLAGTYRDPILPFAD